MIEDGQEEECYNNTKIYRKEMIKVSNGHWGMER